ncbi:hypothetical protein L9G15_24130, partial [Shewanella sp. A3A]|nr:hypothetical protein [Shewanella ferrihydritica]
ETVPSSVTTAPTAVVRVETRLRTWHSLLATRRSAQTASNVETARGRLKICAMPGHLKVSFVWIAMTR